ncbi:MAG: metallopeptidase family protein [Proteobacteria bacterium]|nr:metallopeptidase family protein [Pseudomonadota bacterium]
MAQALERRRIVMNFSTAPQPEDMHAVVSVIVDSLPAELESFCEDMEIFIEEFAPREILDELEVESEFDLLAVYRASTEKIPGVVAKNNKKHGCHLIVFRRPVLDLWCDTGEDFQNLLRNVVISEVAQANGFSDEEIEAICAAAAEAAASAF